MVKIHAITCHAIMQKKTGKTAKIETEHNKTTSGHMNSLNQPGSLGVFGWCAHQTSLEPPQKKSDLPNQQWIFHSQCHTCYFIPAIPWSWKHPN
jgi:hypothetical protein